MRDLAKILRAQGYVVVERLSLFNKIWLVHHQDAVDGCAHPSGGSLFYRWPIEDDEWAKIWDKEIHPCLMCMSDEEVLKWYEENFPEYIVDMEEEPAPDGEENGEVVHKYELLRVINPSVPIEYCYDFGTDEPDDPDHATESRPEHNPSETS